MVGDGDGKGITSICKVNITILLLHLSILCHDVGVSAYIHICKAALESLPTPMEKGTRKVGEREGED